MDRWLARLSFVLLTMLSRAEAAEPILVPQLGHTGYVRAVSFSPDDRYLATGGADQSAIIWEVSTRRVWAVLNGHSSTVMATDWGPDGRTVATCSEDGTVRFWDAIDGRPIGEPLHGHGSYVNSLSWSRAGGLLATGGGYGEFSVCFWDPATRQLLGQKLTGPEGPGQAVSLSSDGRLLAAASPDGKLWLVDAVGRRPLCEPLQGHGGPIQGLSVCPDGRTVATVSTDQTIRLWDVAAQQCRAVLSGHGCVVSCVAYSPDGRLLASGDERGFVRLWSAAGEPVGEPILQGSCVFGLTWSHDGRLLAAANADCVVHLLDPTSGRRLGESFAGHTSRVTSLSWRRDGRALAFGSLDASAGVWDLSRAELSVTHLAARTVAWSPDGANLALAGGGSDLLLSDVEGGQPAAAPLAGQHVDTRGVAWSPDGKQVATVSLDGAVRVYDTDTRQLVRQIDVGDGQLYAVAWSPDGRRLAAGGGANNVHLLGVDGQPGPILTGTSDIEALCFSSDGAAIVAAEGYGSRRLAIWDAASGRPLHEPLALSGEVNTVAFSPDGRLLAAGCSDAQTWLVDVQTWQVAGPPLTGQTGGINALAWSPDGALLAVGSGAVWIWSAAERTLKAALHALDGGADSLAVLPSGHFAGSLEGSRLVRWRLGGELVAAEQYEQAFRRPDMVVAALGLRAGPTVEPTPQAPPALTAADTPPEVRIEVIGGEVVITTGQVQLRIIVTPTRPEATVEQIELRVNGRSVTLDRMRGLQLRGGRTGRMRFGQYGVTYPNTDDNQPVTVETTVALLQGERVAHLTASAWDERQLRGDSNTVTVTRSDEQTEPEALPDLYVLSVGVSQYSTPQYSLAYADADAKALAELLADQGDRAFDRVQTHLLLNADATRDRVLAELEWLATTPQAKDVAVVLLSGHGLQGQAGRLYYATHECDLDSVRDTCLSWPEVGRALTRCPARQRLLLMDCCHAGAFGEVPEGSRFVFVPTRSPMGEWGASADDLARDICSSAGAMVLASCKGGEVSLERAEWGHGAFTLAVLEGLAGRADPYNQGAVTVANLLGYVQARVRELTEGRQTPWIPKAEQFDTSLVLSRLRP